MNGETKGAIEEPMETSSSLPVNQKQKSDINETSDTMEVIKTKNKDDLSNTNKKSDTEKTNIESPSAKVPKLLVNDPCSTNDIKSEINVQDQPNNNSQVTTNNSIEDAISVKNEDLDEVDSEQLSQNVGLSKHCKVEPLETLVVNSDSKIDSNHTFQESDVEVNKDVINLDKEKAKDYNGGTPSPEIHEITSDNDDECVVTDTVKSNAVRISCRKIKKKTFGDDFENGDDGNESDVEEVVPEDPLKRKIRPISISDAIKLVDNAKESKFSLNLKKEKTVATMDKNKAFKAKMRVKNLPITISRTAPVGVPISKLTVNQNNLPSILPSLTDDMFVVEAPSFIVPYVYEKPSVKAFREFVDVLGRELEEEKVKEEKERLLKKKAEKEKKQNEKESKLACGETVEESEEEESIAENEETAKKAKKRKHDPDDDDSWDGESSSYSEDEILSDEEIKTVVESSDISEIKSTTAELVEKYNVGKPDSYFDCSLGSFFINIGINLVQEFVQTDLLKQQNRKLYKEKKAGRNTESTQSSIISLSNNIEISKKNNAPYTFKQKKCEFCTFKSESSLVLAHHLETPHMKNNVYKCNYCSFEIKSPHDILHHMDVEHHVKGRLERAPAYHQCTNCPFEDNGKGKLARHLIPCAKKFKPDLNLAPPVEWEPPAKIPKITRSRNTLTGSYGQSFNRGGQGGSVPRPGVALAAPGSQFRARGRSPLPAAPVRPTVTGLPIIRGGAVLRQNPPTPVLVPSNLTVINNGKTLAKVGGKGGAKGQQPSVSITPLPRHPPPSTPIPLPGSHNKSSFVICEICDGYIKDLEQLRNHMQWIHRVKIHPKMIYNRPPLNCQKCQVRFFTDQGLERHLLGTHGLVTSSMQEAANKGKDAGRCPVCGRFYQWKLLAHVARDHNVTLKPAHLSYKCTVCTATFGMYKQFESHVYSVHSVVAKRVMDKGKATPSTTKPINDTLVKPLKISDEITITPQPVKAATSCTKTS